MLFRSRRLPAVPNTEFAKAPSGFPTSSSAAEILLAMLSGINASAAIFAIFEDQSVINDTRKNFRTPSNNPPKISLYAAN